MNAADSESLARRLLAAGYVEDSLERADVAILNTCVVRQASEDRVYSKLHELKAWKTPERTIAVTGCIWLIPLNGKLTTGLTLLIWLTA